MSSGEMFIKDTFVVACVCNRFGCANRVFLLLISPESQDGELQVSGCAEERPDGSKKARGIGEFWLQGTAPFRYRMACKTCSLGITIVRSSDQCRCRSGPVWSSSSHCPGQGRSERGTFLDPGCMAMEGRRIIACGVNRLPTLQLSSHPRSAAAKLSAQKFRFC